MQTIQIKDGFNLPQMHSINEAAEVVGSRTTVYKLIRSGQLEVMYILSKPHIINLEEFLQRKVEEAKANAAKMANA